MENQEGSAQLNENSLPDDQPLISKIEDLKKKIADLENDSKDKEKLSKSVKDPIDTVTSWLQILAMIMTIFLAGAIGFGWFGVTNIFKINEIKYSMSESLDIARADYEKIKILHSETISNVKTIEKVIEATESDIKNEISQLQVSIDYRIEALIKQYEKRFEDAQIEIGKRAEETQRKIDVTGKDLSGLKSNFSKGLDNIRKDYNNQLSSLNEILEKSKETMEVHHKRIDDVELMLKNFFQQAKTESIVYGHKDRMKIVGYLYPTGDKEKKHGILFAVFKLKEVPINETVKIRYHLFQQPPKSYAMYKNIVVFQWGDDEEKLKNKPFYIDYVPDPTQKSKSIDFKLGDDGTLFIEGKKIDAQACFNIYANNLKGGLKSEKIVD